MYQPLELSNNMKLSDLKDNIPEKPYLKRMAGGDVDMFADFYHDPAFMTTRYEGDYTELNDLLRARWRQLYVWATGFKPEKDVLSKPNRATVKDSLLTMIIAEKWRRHMKVYCFDKELEQVLTDVDKVRVPVKMLDKLPFKTFYIEFNKDGMFSEDFHGAFIDAVKYKNGYLVQFIRVTDDLRTGAGKGVFAVESDDIDPQFLVDKASMQYELDENGIRKDWDKFCFFALNAMLYLCASNAEVRESKRSTYKPPKNNPSGKWSDMQILECGYAFGESVRMMKKKYVDEDGPDKSIKLRTIRPHPVKASWQHYWIGHGDNKERILKFKEEYTRGGKMSFATVSRVETK